MFDWAILGFQPKQLATLQRDDWLAVKPANGRFKINTSIGPFCNLQFYYS